MRPFTSFTRWWPRDGENDGFRRRRRCAPDPAVYGASPYCAGIRDVANLELEHGARLPATLSGEASALTARQSETASEYD